jgi:putative ABC transport system ATP-binding protein
MITVSSLTKRYQGESIDALDKICMKIRSGEAVALMGPSGSGKSTLLHLLGTLDTPTSGTISFKGRALSSYRPFHCFRAEHVGFVFQFHHLIPTMTILENIAAPMKAFPMRKNLMRRRAEELVEAVGLGNRKHSLPSRVSGGERQRAAIARALANEPELILADEPTGNLDSTTGAAIMELLFSRRRKHGVTLLVATHNASIADMMDRVIRLQDGRIISQN